MTAKALSALSSVIDPELRLPITELGMVGEIQEEPNSVKVVIKLTIVGCPAAQSIERDVNEALAAKFKHVEVVMTTMSQEERAALTKKLRGDRPAKFNPFVEKDNLTKVIFVSSGKGGVGKSTNKKSKSPQNTSVKNCSTALWSIGPRQATGWLSETKKPIEISFTS